MTPARKTLLKRLMKIGVAAALLAGLYTAADWRSVGRVLASLDAGYLMAGLLLFVPQTLVSAIRWRRLVSPLAAISLGEAVRQTLAASALNLVVPSKLGELSKAAMLPLASAGDRARAGGLALLEKAADVAALALLWAGGWLAIDGLTLCGVLLTLVAAARWTRLRASSGCSLAAFSLVLWTLHLLQIDCFLKAAGVFAPWSEAASRVPAAIFAGLLPISFCGIGTRDSALIWLFSDLAPASVMAAVGALTALRYLVPGAAGIPLVLAAAPRRSEPARFSSHQRSGKLGLFGRWHGRPRP
ncbi:MAG TPA: lysylphosphatidylglycerol synthase domain-containing protein [Pirellulales bacterium]|nr:lysylphosphatidylglycerol synthase domain-containing protein [Pirellulales bacterium]